MFKFKINIDSEHKFETKVNNEHSFKTYIRNIHDFVFTAIDALIYFVATFIPIEYRSTTEIKKAVMTVKEKGEDNYSLKEKIIFTIQQRFDFKGNAYRLNQKEGRTKLSDWSDFQLIDLPNSLQILVGNGIGLITKIKTDNSNYYFTDSLNSGRLIKAKAENEYKSSVNEALFEIRKR